MDRLHYTKFNELVEKIRQDKAWFEPFIALCKEYYIENGTGGSLHIVLDDGNLAKHHIDWCAGYACGSKDWAGDDIANLMIWMTSKQRRKVYRNYSLYAQSKDFS